jgi:hypothetical protein
VHACTQWYVPLLLGFICIMAYQRDLRLKKVRKMQHGRFGVRFQDSAGVISVYTACSVCVIVCIVCVYAMVRTFDV